MTSSLNAVSRLISSLTVVTMIVTMTTMSSVTSGTVTSLPVGSQQTPDFRRVGQPRDPLPYYVIEELDASTPVGSVPIDAMLDRVYDEVQLKNIRYTIGSQTMADRGERVDLFIVDVISGIVRTATRIDRDVLCYGRLMCVVSLDVIVSPVEFFRIIRIAIDIVDINDHVPDFGIAEFQLGVPESAVAGSSYALPVAVDRDSEQFGVIEYQLLTENADSPLPPFKLRYDLRYNELQLVVTTRLDREISNLYRLVIVSHDGGQPAGTGSVRLLVNVEDDNDNEPVFDRPTYDFDVIENSPPGTIVGRVHANDKDIGIRGRIGYQLQVSGQPQHDGNEDLHRFLIDPDSGVIYVGTTLDYERGAEYRLRVMAHDMASDADNDDNETGNELSTTGNVGEWTTHPSGVKHQSEQTIRFGLETVGTNATEIVSIRNDFVSTASNGRMPDGSLTGYAVVRIRIVDRNDNAPRITVNTFRSPPDVAFISELALPGTFVAYVTVSDADAGSNGLVTCSVHNVSENEVDTDSTFFRLEAMPSSPSTSQVAEYRLMTSSTLDRERNRHHIIGIVCRDFGDEGETSRESRVDVIVEVADENDNSPRFERSLYEIDIVENNSVGDVIAVVKAIDNDHGVNGQVRYQLDTGYEHLFSVDAEQGSISTRVSFDREHLSSLTFAVIAVDLGVPTSLSSTASVRINVLDADDHAPTFDRRDYTFAVYENRPVGTDVGRVTAVDHDIDIDNDVDDSGGDEYRFRYDLVPDQAMHDGGGDGGEFPFPFGINPTSGRIFTKSTLDRERRSEYRLHVLAHATSGIFRSVTSTALVVVHVLDVNDNRPRIHWPPPPKSRDSVADPIRVSAAAPVGHVIAVVSAEDPDAGENGRLQYAVVGVDDNGNVGASLFGALSPEEGRIIVRGPLADSLTMTSSSEMLSRTFALTVVVSDCGSPRMTATSLLNIVVDGSLPFAHAHQRTIALGSGKRSATAVVAHSTAVIVVMSCLSAMFVLLLVAVLHVLRRYLEDRVRYGIPSKGGAAAAAAAVSSAGEKIGANRKTDRFHPRHQLWSCLKSSAYPFTGDVEVGIRGTAVKQVGDSEDREERRRKEDLNDETVDKADYVVDKNIRSQLETRPSIPLKGSCSNDSKYEILDAGSERLLLTAVSDNETVWISEDGRSTDVATFFRV